MPHQLLISSQFCGAILLLIWINHMHGNSVDPDQLASGKAS